MAAATMVVGVTESGRIFDATIAIAQPVASAPPTSCWKKNGSARLFSRRPIRSISAVMPAANMATTASPPMSTAMAAAMPA